MKASVVGHVAWREIEGQTFVLDLARNVMYGLNVPGGMVWRALQEGGDLTATANALGPGRPDAANRAVTAFVGELASLGLVASDVCAPEAPVEAADLSFVPPQVVWHEQLRSFGQGVCGLRPAQGGPCLGAPQYS